MTDGYTAVNATDCWTLTAAPVSTGFSGNIKPSLNISLGAVTLLTRMWADAQRDGRPAEYRWRPLFNAAKFG